MALTWRRLVFSSSKGDLDLGWVRSDSVAGVYTRFKAASLLLALRNDRSSYAYIPWCETIFDARVPQEPAGQIVVDGATIFLKPSDLAPFGEGMISVALDDPDAPPTRWLDRDEPFDTNGDYLLWETPGSRKWRLVDVIAGITAHRSLPSLDDYILRGTAFRATGTGSVARTVKYLPPSHGVTSVLSPEITYALLDGEVFLGTQSVSVRKGDVVTLLPSPEFPLELNEVREPTYSLSADTNRPAGDASLGHPLAVWNTTIEEPYIAALSVVGSRRAMSAVPRFDVAGASASRWTATYSLGEHAFVLENLEPSGTGATVTVELRGLQAHDGKSVRRSCALNVAERTDGVLRTDGLAGFHFRLQDAGAPLTTSQTARLGSLDVVVPLRARALEQWTLSAGWTRRSLVALPAETASPEVVLIARIPVDGVTPVAQDGVGPDTPASFVVPIPPNPTRAGAPQAPAPAWTLEVTERLRENDRTYAMDLGMADNATGTSPSYLIIDPAPFLVVSQAITLGTRLHFESSGFGDAEDPSTESTWLTGSKGPLLLFPPQAVGEETLRPVYPPTPPFPAGATYGYAFSGSTRLGLRLAPLAGDRNWAMAPWNVRRLFDGTGAPVRSLDTEVLYGLSLGIRPTSVLQAAEVIGRLGRYPRRSEKADSISGRVGSRTRTPEATLEFSDALASRLATLALVDPSVDAIVSAPITTGLTFAFRKWWPPRTSENSQDPPNPNAADPLTDDPLRDWPHKLRGGAGWGFDQYSAALFNSFKDEVSHSGEIEGLQITALGGSGNQTALFANGLSKIISRTYLGRTFYYSVERRGRIATLWHPAKYVKIFERKVSSADPGRAIFQQTDEFVQVLSPSRSYPDQGDDGSAFLRAVHFPKDAKYEVQSNWAYTVPDGWVMPLAPLGAGPPSSSSRRSAHASPSPAALPTVTFELDAGTPDGAGSSATLANSDVLLFYTCTKVGASGDVESWPPVPGVDRALAATPTRSQAASSPSETTLPPLSAVPRGHEAFTFRLSAGGAVANLLRGRQPNPVVARIENVTLARGDLRNDLSPVLPCAQPFLSACETFVTKARELIPASIAGWQSAKVAFETMMSVTSAEMNAIRAALPPPLSNNDLTPSVAAFQKTLNEGFTTTVSAEAKAETLANTAATILASADAAQALQAEAVRLLSVLSQPPSVVDAISQALGVARDAERSLGDLAAGHAANLAQLIARPNLATGVPVLAEMISELAEARSSFGGAFAGLLPAASAATVGELKKLVDYLVDSTKPPPVPALFGKLYSGVGAAAALDALRAAAKTWQGAIATVLQLEKLEQLRDNPTPPADAAGVVAILGVFKQALNGTTLSSALDHFATTTIPGLTFTGPDGSSVALFDSLFVKSVSAATAWATSWAPAEVEAKALSDLATSVRRIPTNLVAAKDLQALGTSTLRLLATATLRLDGLLSLARVGFAPTLPKITDPTMRMIRAFGAAPVANGLALTRDAMAYYYQSLENGVLRGLPSSLQFDGVNALLNRGASELEQLGLKAVSLRVPTQELADGFVAALPTSGFSLSSLLPDIAGIQLDNLFPGVNIADSHNFSIKHGLDAASRQAWAECDVNVPIPEAAIFNAGPLSVSFVGSLTADVRMVAGLNGVSRQSNGQLKGTWKFKIGGAEVIALADVTAAFDTNGHLSFSMSPQSVRLPGVLQALSDVLAKGAALLAPGSGLNIELLKGASGVPRGVRAALSLVLRPIQAGAVSISNLALSMSFCVAMDNGFTLSVDFGFARPETPFNISILCLGGGGWFVTRAIATVLPNFTVVGQVDVGISAGANLPFDIGIVSGGVSLLAAVSLQWTGGTAGGSSVCLTLRVALRGEVNLLGIVSVQLYLGMDATYDGATLRATGTIRLTVKIGWIINITIEQSVTLTLGSVTKPTATPALVTASRFVAFSGPTVDDALDAYRLSFAGEP